MKNQRFIIILGIIIFAATIIATSLLLYKDKINHPLAFIEGKTIALELAKSNKELERGLMFREILDYNSGMLFIFPDEQTRYFWMKNTLIPLDIIFIDKNHKITDIQSAEQCANEPCQNYVSKKPAKYALEVNMGYCKEHNITIGNEVEFVNI